MILRRTPHVLILIFAIVFLSSCATKKYVNQQVGAARTELSGRLDEEAGRRGDLGNQVQELSALNKRNSARIDEVGTNIDGAVNAVKTINPKIEDAKKTAGAAQETATQALEASKSNATVIANRSNYQTISTNDVHFGSGSFALDDKARDSLGQIVKAMAADKNLILELRGYTDSVGDPQYNLQLSNKRVESVIRYLVGSANIDLHRIFSLGLGKEAPGSENKTAAGRAKNRRVSLTVLGVK